MTADNPTGKQPCPECQGTGKLVYSNTGIENDCLYCNGFGVVQAKLPPKQPREPQLEDYATYNDYIGNWQAWYNTMVGMGWL